MVPTEEQVEPTPIEETLLVEEEGGETVLASSEAPLNYVQVPEGTSAPDGAADK